MVTKGSLGRACVWCERAGSLTVRHGGMTADPSCRLRFAHPVTVSHAAQSRESCPDEYFSQSSFANHYSPANHVLRNVEVVFCLPVPALKNRGAQRRFEGHIPCLHVLSIWIVRGGVELFFPPPFPTVAPPALVLLMHAGGEYRVYRRTVEERNAHIPLVCLCAKGKGVYRQWKQKLRRQQSLVLVSSRWVLCRARLGGACERRGRRSTALATIARTAPSSWRNVSFIYISPSC